MITTINETNFMNVIALCSTNMEAVLYTLTPGIGSQWLVVLLKYSALVLIQKSPSSHLVPAGGNLMCFEILLCLDLISQQNVELDLMLRKTLSLAIRRSIIEVVDH